MLMAQDASFEAEIYELRMNDLWMGNAENRANLASWLDLADWLYGSCSFDSHTDILKKSA